MGWTIRPYRENEASRMEAFFADAGRLDATLRPMNEAAWRAFASSLGPQGDLWVAEAEGAIRAVAYASELEPDPSGARVRRFRIIVHPAHRRRGVGSSLYERIAGGAVLQAACMAAWKEGVRFLERRGFARTHEGLEMEREGDAPPPGEAPKGARLRAGAGPEDLAALARLHNEIFSGTVGFFRMTNDEAATRARHDGFHLWLAEAEGVPAGFCQTQRDDDDAGRIESLAVSARVRLRGVGRALLTAGMRTLGERGHRRLRLSVEAGNEPAIRLYESAGFRQTERILIYRSR